MPTNSNIERALGIVVGKLEGIEGRLERQDESRAALHNRLDQLVIRTTHVESAVESLTRRTDEMQSVTDDVKTLRTQAEGAGTLGRWLIRIGIGVVTLAGWVIGAWTYLTGRPPP